MGLCAKSTFLFCFFVAILKFMKIDANKTSRILNDNYILYKYQFGFKNYSANSTLLEVT